MLPAPEALRYVTRSRAAGVQQLAAKPVVAIEAGTLTNVADHRAQFIGPLPRPDFIMSEPSHAWFMCNQRSMGAKREIPF
jgi:hypothetical protein